MKREEVIAALNRLRAATRPNFDDSRFAEKARLKLPTVKGVKAGNTLPNILHIQQWAEACGVSLSQFIAGVELGGAVAAPIVEERAIAARKPSTPPPEHHGQQDDKGMSGSKRRRA